MCFSVSLFLLRVKFWGHLLAILGQIFHLFAFEASPFPHQFNSFIDCHHVDIHSIQIRSRPEVKFSHSVFIFLSWGFPSWSGYCAVPNLASMMNFCGPFVPVCLLVGVLGNITIFCCTPQGRVSLKQSMTAVESIIPVFVKSDLKQAMCLSMFPVDPLNLISFILAHASPVWSKGLNASKKLVSNTAKVQKSRGTPCFLQLRIACPTNCSFQNATSSSVSNDKMNAIFLLSLL